MRLKELNAVLIKIPYLVLITSVLNQKYTNIIFDYFPGTSPLKHKY